MVHRRVGCGLRRAGCSGASEGEDCGFLPYILVSKLCSTKYNSFGLKVNTIKCSCAFPRLPLQIAREYLDGSAPVSVAMTYVTPLARVLPYPRFSLACRCFGMLRDHAYPIKPRLGRHPDLILFDIRPWLTTFVFLEQVVPFIHRHSRHEAVRKQKLSFICRWLSQPCVSWRLGKKLLFLGTKVSRSNCRQETSSSVSA